MQSGSISSLAAMIKMLAEPKPYLSRRVYWLNNLAGFKQYSTDVVVAFVDAKAYLCGN